MTLAHLAKKLRLCILLFGIPSVTGAEGIGLCVTSVFNDPKQMSPVEIRQPYRLVGSHATGVLSEYPGLILNPINRNGIYTVSSGEYKKVPENIASQISKWGAGKKRVKTPFNAADLPKGFTHNDMRAEFYPELGLFLTRNANSIWYREPDEPVWHRYVKAGLWSGFKKREMGGSWEKPKVWRNTKTGLVVMTLGPQLLLVGSQAKTGASIEYAYQALRAGRFIDPIYHEASENLLFWKEDRNLYQLTVSGIKRVRLPWSRLPPPTQDMKSWDYPRFSQKDPKTGDVLFRHFAGMARYDGTQVIDIRHWNTAFVSRYTRIVWLGNTRYAVNTDGIFALDDELRMSLLDVPLAMRTGDSRMAILPAFGYSYSDEFQRILMVDPRSGRIFTTEDFSDFYEVQDSEGSPISAFVSDIPGENAALFRGRDGLYQVTHCGQ